MVDAIRALTERVRRLDKVVRQAGSKQIFQKGIKDEARNIVDDYFRRTREMMVIGKLDGALLTDLDAKMQRLLEIVQRKSTSQTYRTIIKVIEADLLSIEKQALILSVRSNRPDVESIDRRIIDTLTSFLPSAARSYEQAINDLKSSDRLSWRGPATDLRESLRETLDHLAPDADVMGEPGFKLEKDTALPTMKQKVRYILRKRGLARTAIQSPEAATQAVDEIVGTFVRSVYSRASVSTHTPTDRNEILRIRDWVRITLCELLEIPAGA